MADREEDRELLKRDLEEVERVRNSLFSRIGYNPDLLVRLQIFLVEIERLTELEMLIRYRLERLSHQAGVDETGQRKRLEEQ